MAKFTLGEIVKLFGEYGKIAKFADNGMVFVQFKNSSVGNWYRFDQLEKL